MSTCTTCGCEAPVGGVSCENGPVGSVRKGSNVRVSDRNGIPKNLDNLDKSILVSSEDEGVEARDGSHDRPIFLNLDDLVTAGAVVITSDDGKLGAIKANGSQNQIFGFFNGGIGFKDETAAIPEFESSQLESSSGGKLASFGCSANGKVRLTSFNPNIQSTKYLTIGEDGNVDVSDHDIDGCPSADAVEDGEIDYILGCKGGNLVILPPQEGKILKEEDGKWVVSDAVSSETAVFGANIWNKAFSATSQLTFVEETVNFGSAVPDTAEWVQIGVAIACSTSTTYGVLRIYVNDVPVILSRTQGSFQCWQGSIALYVPYGTGSFKIRGNLDVSAAGSGTGDGSAEASILSYK